MFKAGGYGIRVEGFVFRVQGGVLGEGLAHSGVGLRGQPQKALRASVPSVAFGDRGTFLEPLVNVWRELHTFCEAC